MGKIRLNGIKLYGFHGCFAEEKKLGQLYEIDIEIDADLKAAAISDDLSKTVDYTKVYDIAQKIFTNEKHNVMETTADRIGKEIAKMEKVESVLVRIRKPGASIVGVLDDIEVEIVN